MPLSLQILKAGEKIFEISLDQKKLLRIGRGLDQDLILHDPEVSREHLVLRKKDTRWRVENCSRNGVWIDQQPLPAGGLFPLCVQSQIQISRLFQMKLVEVSSKREITRISLDQKTKAIVLRAETDALIMGNARLVNAETEIDIGADGLSVGSHPSNDLILEDEEISQFHARIDLHQNAFRLIDLCSTNGSFLNGVKISRAPLEEDSEIRFGRKTFQFQLNENKKKLRTRSSDHFFGMVSQSVSMRRLFSLVEVAAPTEAPIYLKGETGTGKELFAKAIHQLSPRFDRAFISLNCASFPKDLIESELFGHEKGAFTGAADARPGAFEAANGGSLFLDEIGEMDLNVQSKLLRTLETGEVKRLGANQTRPTSVRIICATHRDLKKMVDQGRFREDLYYRLNVVPVEIPPLRQRKEDLDVLIPELLNQLKMSAELSDHARQELASYSFPGNVRELKNILQRALIQSKLEKSILEPEEKRLLDAQHFHFLHEIKISDPAAFDEKQTMLQQLSDFEFNQSRLAESMGLAVSTLHDKLRRLGIDVKKEKAESRRKAL